MRVGCAPRRAAPRAETRLGAAPRHLPALLAQYEKLHAAKKAQVKEQRSFLDAGLAKLSGAAARADELARVAADPVLAGGLTNPRFAAALDDMRREPMRATAAASGSVATLM